MGPRKITLAYDATAERMLTRVTMLRFGVPQRVIDRELPLEDS